MLRRRLALTGAFLCVFFAAQAQSASEYNATGVGHYNAGEWDKAVEAFLKAYELAPDNTTVRANLCNAYQAAAHELAKAADFTSATKLLEQAIGVSPDNSSPLIQLASYYLRLDLVSDAIFRLEEATDLDPENVTAHDLLGDAYYKANDLPTALAEWEWVKSVEPNRAGLREKLEKAQREESVERDFVKTKSRHFEASFAPGTNRRDLSNVLYILEQAYIDVGRKLGYAYPTTPIQVIVYTAEGFSDATLLAEHVGAVYDGKIRIPLQDTTGQTIGEEELRRRLTHEYVHVVLRFLANGNAPWWLNEGLAETFSRPSINADMKTMLAKARDENRLFRLANLEGPQLQQLSVDELRLAYCQAYAMVQHLWDRFGSRVLCGFLASLAEGTPAAEAFSDHYKRTYDMFEKEIAYTIPGG